MSKYKITMDGKIYEMVVELVVDEDPKVEKKNISVPKYNSHNTNIQIMNPAMQVKTELGGNVVNSPMPGTVIKILAKKGETVTAGQKILILEAMKMENEIVAQKAGKIKDFFVKEKDTVLANKPLFEME